MTWPTGINNLNKTIPAEIATTSHGKATIEAHFSICNSAKELKDIKELKKISMARLNTEMAQIVAIMLNSSFKMIRDRTCTTTSRISRSEMKKERKMAFTIKETLSLTPSSKTCSTRRMNKRRQGKHLDSIRNNRNNDSIS